VLSRAVQAAGLEWDSGQAHSAVYDTERTAELFCRIVNRWRDLCLQGDDCAPPNVNAAA
jgi:ribonuclease T